MVKELLTRFGGENENDFGTADDVILLGQGVDNMVFVLVDGASSSNTLTLSSNSVTFKK
jgi:hypothetical protein